MMPLPTDGPAVYWLVGAQRSLQTGLAIQLAQLQNNQSFQQHRQSLSQRLAVLFPNARTVIVRDRMAGYRNNPTLHVLLVEIIPRPDQPDPEEPGVHIVKLGDVAHMMRELQAWQSCHPAGFMHDNILVALNGGFDASGGLVGLIYGDAFHVLGARDVVTLEEACMDCIQYGHPTPSALDSMLSLLYQRLDRYFYQRSFTEESTSYLDGSHRPNLDHLLWSYDEPRQVHQSSPDPDHFPLDALRLRWRRETLGFLAPLDSPFLDAGDYLNAMIRCPQLAPRILCGCSHGDLHGRNILVHVEEQSVQPAMFDYENMGPNNLIGWDFVKLETELKSRALATILPNTREHDYIREVLQFDTALASYTQAFYYDEHLTLPDCIIQNNPAMNRLAILLLGIRRLARRHLEQQRSGRHSEWLKEYYFLLAWYGLRAGLFPTYQRRMFMSAYISAGVACTQLATWPGQPSLVDEMRSRAESMLSLEGPLQLPEDLLPRPDCELSHHPRFHFARAMVGNGLQSRPEAVQIGVNLLRLLHQQYPHVIEIVEELTMGLMELNQEQEARALLEQVCNRYETLTEEILCRWGRVFKKHATELFYNRDQVQVNLPLTQQRRAAIHAEFNQSQFWYRRAYTIRHHYYPGINVASLSQFLGETEAARSLARNILTSLADHGDNQWIAATRGEANLLLGNHDQARVCYECAVATSSPRDRESMCRQIRLLRDFGNLQGEPHAHWGEDQLTALFGLQ